MVLVMIRTAIIFAVLLVVMRLMGKRQIGEMQPFELVITLLIAELTCIPMADTSIPRLYGIVSVLAIFVLHEAVTLLALKKNNLDVSDLIESLRAAGYFSLDCIDYALYESNGTFSALPKENYEQMQTSLPLVIIDNGKFNGKNLALTGLGQEYFETILREQGVRKHKNVLVLTADGEGKIYLQEKKEKFRTFRVQYPGNKTW